MKKKICSTLLHFVPLFSILFLLLGSIINIPRDTDHSSNGPLCSTVSDDDPMYRDGL